MSDNVVDLRPLEFAEQVLRHASEADLEHVIVLGIKKGGGNYFEATGVSTLKDLVWLTFCGSDTVQRMANGGSKTE